MKSEKWHQLERQVLRRDGFGCRFCGAKATSAYHLSLRYGWSNPGAIVSVCGPCRAMLRMGFRRHIGYRLAARPEILNSRKLRALLCSPEVLTAFAIIGLCWSAHWAAGLAVLGGVVIVLAKQIRRL
jgi:hypothetical protein